MGRAREAANSAKHMAVPYHMASWRVFVSGIWGTVKWNLRLLTLCSSTALLWGELDLGVGGSRTTGL